MNELHLFAGAGGGILGGILCGHTCVCAVEIEPYCRKVLLQRQRDGILPKFPIWDDIRTFDGNPWRGRVDVVCGGFPCQDISAAGKGAGITGERSSLWKEMARVIGEVQPRYVLAENSPLLRTRGLATVLKDLAEMGYDAEWGVIGAHHAGAPHKRDRMWILAAGRSDILSHPKLFRIRRGEQQPEGVEEAQGNVANSMPSWKWRGKRKSKIKTNVETRNVANTSDQGLWSCVRGNGRELDNQDSRRCHFQGRSGSYVKPSEQRKTVGQEPGNVCEILSNTDSTQRKRGSLPSGVYKEDANTCKSRWWEVEPNVGRVANGVASRLDRLKAIGNGQVSEVVRIAWETLSQRLLDNVEMKGVEDE